MAVEGVIEERNGAVLRLTINRPERLNALTVAVIDELTRCVRAAGNDGTRVVVITGAGRAFSSGADVGPDGTPPGMDTLTAANALAEAIVACPAVIVAGVNGIAAGVGCSIALTADLAVAKESAAFMLAFTKIGLMPDGGASLLVPAGIGRARAMRMALLAEKIPASRAFEWGMISHLAADDEFEATLEALVAQLGAGAPLAQAETKASVNAATIEGLPAILAFEGAHQEALLATADFAEGMRAFQEKRPAEFTGA